MNTLLSPFVKGEMATPGAHCDTYTSTLQGFTGTIISYSSVTGLQRVSRQMDKTVKMTDKTDN